MSDTLGSSSSRVVVITGASAGVGRAIACGFARRGDRIALLARGAAGLAAARAEAEAAGAGAAIPIPTDVADAEQVTAAARRVDDELGPVDVWVNNAMTSVFAPMWEVTPGEFRRVTDVTYLGYVHGALAALERMRPRDRGTLVFVGSALGYRGIPAQAAYCAAKHAAQGLRDSLRAELLAEGSAVRLTTVNLPALNTPQFTWVRTRLPRHPQPLPPIYQPEVAAEAVLWAADHTPRELNVGVSTVLTRVTNKVAPGLLDRYLGATALEDQQGEQAVGSRPDNLDVPVDQDEDYGAHGAFDDRSATRSLQLWATTHKPHVAVAGVALAASAAGWVRAR